MKQLTTKPSIPKPPATPPSVVQRIPADAFDTFTGEAIRQRRPVTLIISGAAKAFASLPVREREAFTIGEPPTIETAVTLLQRTGPAPANRRKAKVAK